MSNLSSNSLFHFTSKAEYLIGILKNDFIPRYCYEETTLNKDLNRGKLLGALPMVCFCDIPLGQITNHLATYGSYGIGMSKEWGIKNKLNPIIYINENSKLANSFGLITDSIYNLLDEEHCSQNAVQTGDEILKIVKYIKPYKGNFSRNGEVIKNVKFYNEREWRYIPDIETDEDENIIDMLIKEDFENPIKLAKENSQLEKYKLEFTPNDIKYIFVKNESEIHHMMKAIREIKGGKFNAVDIDILTSKILTTEQIKEDF